MALAGAENAVGAGLNATFASTDPFGSDGAIIARAGLAYPASDGSTLWIVFVGQAVAIVVDTIVAVGAVDGFGGGIVVGFANDLGGDASALDAVATGAEFAQDDACCELSAEVFIDLPIAIVVETVALFGSTRCIFGFTSRPDPASTGTFTDRTRACLRAENASDGFAI